MPELPEVQTVITDLIESGLIGCKLTGIDVHDARIVAEPTFDESL